jgi:hypothetical protein
MKKDDFEMVMMMMMTQQTSEKEREGWRGILR